MQAHLLAYTQQNPALDAASLQGVGDLATLWDGRGDFAENLVEFAGRVCYRSTHRMGTAPEFIPARVREGHEDIIEHVVATLRFSGGDEPLRWRMLNRHCEVSEVGSGEWIVSGNTRVWLDFFRHDIARAGLPFLQSLAPKVFAEYGADEGSSGQAPALDVEQMPLSSDQLERLRPIEEPPMRVTLLGYTQPSFGDPTLALHHGSATFFFEGISRACTHQLVRHRLASFSQESQRYVDLSKGGWRAIVPDAVAQSPEAVAELAEFWRIAEEKYERLRSLGIRKEDARFLLPNAAETRIVTTMNFAAWSHFLWLRAVDKAAQWEIRAMGQAVLKMLYAIAPDVFQTHWDVYQERFAGQ
ncbi:MAG: FAD-dependent thymidylate synthase [Caldilineaceae bacterium]|nr:FAD-dependent thymidylate synthase [Caldilineaceae bacterium]